MQGDDPSQAGDPIAGQVFLVAAAKASVGPDQLPPLVAHADARLRERIDEYRREYECVHEDEARAIFLVPRGHWEELGDELGFNRRERDAIERAHEEQLLRTGSQTDRRDEFESALEIREAVVVSV